MATKTESTEVIQQKKVYVKSEAVLDEMETNGQLEPFTDYYTDDEESAVFDSELSLDSENAVQNKTITAKFNKNLVWQNANPYTQFDEQTINIENIEEYDFIVVKFLVYASTSRDAAVKLMKFPKTTTRKCYLEFSWCEESNLKTFTRSRSFILLNNTSITFYNGYQSSYGTNAEINNMVLVPREIYGINQP